MTMRPHRSGTKLADGRFRTSRQYIGPDGLPVVKQFVSRKGESQKDVLKRADLWQASSAGSLPSPRMSLKDALDLYVKHKERQGLKHKSIKDLKFGTALISAEYGNIQVSKLTPVQIDALTEKWLEKPRTALKIREQGRAAYNWFLKCEWVDKNPFLSSEPVSYSSEDWEEPLSPAHFATTLQKVEGQVYRAILLLLRWTGCRPDAARNLLWSDLTGDDVMWMSHRSKTNASSRPIPVPAEAAEAINALPRKGLFVFTNKGGRPIAESTLIHVWREAQEAAGLTPRRLYDLRHMRLTELAKVATDKELAYLGGHTTVATTKRYYVQVERAALVKKVNG